MIFLTRLNQASFVVNSDLIEHIDITPDTVIALTTGERILVRESAEEVVCRTIEFRRRIAFSTSSAAWTDSGSSPQISLKNDALPLSKT